MAVNRQFPTPVLILYPCSVPTDPTPYPSSDAILNAFIYLCRNKTPAVNGDNYTIMNVSSTGARHPLGRGPVRPDMSPSRAESRPGRL